MNTINKILIPTDFSTSAQNAVGYALKFFEFDQNLKIYVLHVMENHGSEDKKAVAAGEMKETKALFHKVGTCECLLKTGNLTETIIDTQKSLDIDLILMGTAGENGNRESFTSQLVWAADCPVLVVPEKVTSFQIKKIALALDLEEFDNSYDLGIVHAIARWYGAEVHILTINNRTDGSIPSYKKVAGILEYYLDTLDYHYAFPENQDIVKGIDQYVSNNKIDMLVILPRNHAVHKQPSAGRLTQLLARHTQVPLLAVD